MAYKSRTTGNQGNYQTITHEQFWAQNEKGSTSATVIAFSYDTTGQIKGINVHNCYSGNSYGEHTLTYLISKRAREANDGNPRLVIIEANGFTEQSLLNFYQNTSASWTLQIHTEGNVGIAYGMKATAALLFSLSLNNDQCGGMSREKRIDHTAKHLANLVSLYNKFPKWFDAVREQSMNPNPEDHLGTTAMRYVMHAVGAKDWTRMTDAEFIERLFRVMRRNRKNCQKPNFKFCDELGGITAFLIMRYFGSGLLTLGEAIQKVVSNLLTCVKKHLTVDSRPATPTVGDDFFDWMFRYAEITPWTSLKAMRTRHDAMENIAFIKAIVECCLNVHCAGTEELIKYADQIYETYVESGKSGVVGDKTLEVKEKITFPDGSSFVPSLQLPAGYDSDGCVMKRSYDLPNHYVVSGGGAIDFTSVRFPVPLPGNSSVYHINASGLPNSTGENGARFLARLVGPDDKTKMAWKHDVSGGGFTVSSQSGGGCGDGKSTPITDHRLKAPQPLSTGKNGSLVHITITNDLNTKFMVHFKCDDWCNSIDLVYTQYQTKIKGKTTKTWGIQWTDSTMGQVRANYTLNRPTITHLALFFKGLVDITVDEQPHSIVKPVPNQVNINTVNKIPASSSVASSAGAQPAPSLGNLSLGDIIKKGLSQ
jgi:hypothetical protein